MHPSCLSRIDTIFWLFEKGVWYPILVNSLSPLPPSPTLNCALSEEAPMGRGLHRGFTVLIPRLNFTL